MLAMVFRDVPLQLEIPTSSNPEDNYMNSTPQAEILDQVTLQALKDEKHRKLCMEAVRWIDLLRWSGMEDNYASVMALCSHSTATD